MNLVSRPFIDPRKRSARRFAFGIGLALTLTVAGCSTPPTIAPAAKSAPSAPPVPVAAPVVAAPPAPAPVAEAPVVVRPNTAYIPVPQRTEDRLPQNAVNGFNTRHQRYVERAKQGDIDLLFLGDSITQNWGGVGKDVWTQYYGEMKAAAFGIGYDRTQHLLWRLQNGEGEGFSPKAVVIMIGTNNIGLNTPAEIAVGIGAIVHEVRARFANAKILLLGIFPRDLKDSRNRRLVAETNRLVAPLHDGQHLFYLDLADKFIDADGNIPATLVANNPPLHPTAAGHAVWAEAIKEPLANLMK
jgi:beta-glucosidase